MSPGARCASCRRAGSRWRWRRARRARRCGGASRRRRTRSSRARPPTPSAQTEERAANLVRKQALCERAEALAESTDWVRTAAEIQQLQAEWKTIGAGDARPREGDLGALPRRLRSLLHPSSGGSEAAQGRLGRTIWPARRASASAPRRWPSSTDWDAAAAQVKQLQAEWKTIGPVRKSKSEAVWQRFRAACDRFFERYKHRDQLDLREKAEPREAIIRELEALRPARAPPPVMRRTAW